MLAAPLQQNGDYRQPAFFITMEEVNPHVETLAVNTFFGGAVKMEMQQLIPATHDSDGAAVADIDLNVMAGIDDAKLAALVIDGDRLEIDLDTVADVDRRLPTPGGAKPKSGRSFAQLAGEPSPS